MIRIFINALAASAGGGLTYVRNVIPHFAARDDVQATVLLVPRLRQELQTCANVTFIEREESGGVLRRAWFEQHGVRELVRQSRADVLLSTGNFSLWRPGVPQILLSRNSLYTSRDVVADLRRRGEYSLLRETRLKGIMAKWSIQAADRVVAPSEAFAEELRQWTGKPVGCIHHGFDPEVFSRDSSPLPDALRSKIDSGGGALKLLFVSHYNYYRNFETLIRALPLIKQQLHPRRVMLFLTCRLAPGSNPGRYNPAAAAALVHDLSLSENVVELDAVPYPLLHHVYKAADVYVTPAYAESFAHPLVEAMFSGLPVVASDLPVHREICGTAGRYFQRFAPDDLAKRVCEVVGSPRLAAELAQGGVERAARFSWKTHVERVISLARSLVSAGT
jgi:glycosyltransferase involved in cell wall biosynthesis